MRAEQTEGLNPNRQRRAAGSAVLDLAGGRGRTGSPVRPAHVGQVRKRNEAREGDFRSPSSSQLAGLYVGATEPAVEATDLRRPDVCLRNARSQRPITQTAATRFIRAKRICVAQVTSAEAQAQLASLTPMRTYVRAELPLHRDRIRRSPAVGDRGTAPPHDRRAGRGRGLRVLGRQGLAPASVPHRSGAGAPTPVGEPWLASCHPRSSHVLRQTGPAVGCCLPPLHLLVRAFGAFGGLRASAGVLAAGPVPV